MYLSGEITMPTSSRILGIPIFLFLTFFSLIAIGFAQSPGDIGSAKENQEAIATLDRMSPEEIDVLDQKLAEALVLYYDGKYASALPIFKEIALEVETMDILFWLGVSAMKIGETQLAIEKFKKMLVIDPNLHKARLELAAIYFKTGQYNKAKQELEFIRTASPSPETQKKIDRMLGVIKKKRENYSWNLQLSQGIIWDKNINSGPEQKDVPLVRLSPLSEKLEDEGTTTNISGNVLYDIGERSSGMWNTAVYFFNKAYFDYSEFNYMSIDVNTGPWWVGKRDILKIPVGYHYDRYGNDELSYSFHIDPTFEHHFCRSFSLKGLYTFENTNYYADRNSYLDSDRHQYELRPTFYLSNRNHIISLMVGNDDRDAESNIYSYEAPFLGASYFARLFQNTEFYLQYIWTEREYDDVISVYGNIVREDERNSILAVLTQTYLKHWFASFSYAYTDNDSNVNLYSFDKEVYGIKLGYRF
jgi:tetratricopeptide (TPR) repeat protein